MSGRRVLILDDEANIGLSLRLILEREGYRVDTVNSLAQFREMPRLADAYLLDVRLPDGSGIDVLKEIRQTDSEVPVMMISGQATIAEAVEATRAGAFDFLEKPLARDKVLVTLKNALERRSLREENERLREQVSGTRMIGRSPVFAQAVEQARLAARSDARILILGESGTGKELLAAHIHQSSPFAAGPFVKVNCAAIPTELLETELFGHERGAFTGAAGMRRGKFERADGGSIFLDEVGDLPLPAQAKLLRVLQEGEFHRVGGEQPVRVSVRVISATNRDLLRMCGEHQFREDLYYRLNVMPIRVPPLRARREDIGELADYFLADFCRRNNFRAKRLDPAAVAALEGYSWPGNARELRNAVERMAILCPGESIGADAVPLEIRGQQSVARPLVRAVRDDAERDQIRRVLDQSDWNVSQAARVLGMERTNLHKRIRSLGLTRKE
ncbi:MAG: sigma-54-dependent Fis family transcriptional regulator [Acidobacteria bacterium]|nr:sigma-54-dependent Fis family transcriptional regulator [Acidobacteriota bacterium]